MSIFFLEDIRNAILAANEASSATAAVAAAISLSQQSDNGCWCTHVPIITEPEERRFRCDLCGREWKFEDVKAMLRREGGNHALRDYRRGYRAALTTMALSFGLSSAIAEGAEGVKALAGE